jgi:hypothetical protein
VTCHAGDDERGIAMAKRVGHARRTIPLLGFFSKVFQRTSNGPPSNSRGLSLTWSRGCPPTMASRTQRLYGEAPSASDAGQVPLGLPCHTAIASSEPRRVMPLSAINSRVIFSMSGRGNSYRLKSLHHASVDGTDACTR